MLHSYLCPTQTDGSCWELNLSATCSKRKQPGPSSMARRLALAPVSQRKRRARDRMKKAPSQKWVQRLDPGLQVTLQLHFESGSQSRIYWGSRKYKEHHTEDTQHFIFGCSTCYFITCCNSCASYKMPRPRLLLPSLPEWGYGYFQTGLFSAAQICKAQTGQASLFSQPRKHKVTQFLAVCCPWNEVYYW